MYLQRPWCLGVYIMLFKVYLLIVIIRMPSQSSTEISRSFTQWLFFQESCFIPFICNIFSDWLMNSDLGKKSNTLHNCKSHTWEHAISSKNSNPKYLEWPVRLPENSDETWFYIKSFNIQMLKMSQIMLLKYAIYYIANILLVKKKKRSKKHLSQMQHIPFYITSLECSHFISSITSVTIFLKFLTSQTYFSYYRPHDLWVPIAVKTAVRLAL